MEQQKQPPSTCSTSITNLDDDDDDECPIFNLTQDEIYSILLSLPTTSILSFSLTCKKFNSFASNNTLWELICARDWGSKCVDAIKDSNSFNGGKWFQLYEKIVKLGCVCCYRLSGGGDGDGDLGVVPNARASHSLNMVSNCLVLFGGGCEGGRHLDDTWIANLDSTSRKVSKWQKLASGVPTGRFGHTCETSDDFLVLFGGINDHGVKLNDTWVGEILYCGTPHTTLSWRPLDVGPTAPPPRGAHASCCISNRRVLVHGGIGLDGLRLGDLWVLEISENLCHGTWHELHTHPSPPPRSGHTLTNVDRTRTVLFGGRGTGYDVLEDVWLFDLSGNYPKWKQVSFNWGTIPNGGSLARVGHSATVILGGHVLIYGGEDSERRRKDDCWLLDLKVKQVNRMWRRLKVDGCRPNPRSFHATCVDRSGRYVFVFGGMVDGLGLGFDSDLFLIELCLTMS